MGGHRRKEPKAYPAIRSRYAHHVAAPVELDVPELMYHYEQGSIPNSVRRLMASILVRILWTASMAAQAVVLFRIWITADLRYAYAFFASFIGAKLARSLFLVYVDVHSPTYSLIWTISEPILLILQMLAVGEIYDRICHAYPGLGRYKYRLLAITAIVATGSSAFMLLIGIQRMITWRYFVAIMFTGFIGMSAVVFLVLVWALFRNFPIGRRANVEVHWRVLALYFGLNAAASIALVALPGEMWVNAFFLTGVIVCYSIWIMKINPEGEFAQRPTTDDERRQWERSQERASLALSRITVRGFFELVLHPGNSRT